MKQSDHLRVLQLLWASRCWVRKSAGGHVVVHLDIAQQFAARIADRDGVVQRVAGAGSGDIDRFRQESGTM